MDFEIKKAKTNFKQKLCIFLAVVVALACLQPCMNVLAAYSNWLATGGNATNGNVTGGNVTNGNVTGGNVTSGNVSDGNIKAPSKMTIVDGIYYYEISSAEELMYISRMGGQWCGYNYILTDDIVLNSVEITYDSNGKLTVDESTLNKWQPISGFYGVFNGNNHSISGLYVNTRSSAGFFGNCRGDVSNLTITNSYIKGYSNVGGICGSFNETGKDMTNCYFDGAVVGVSSVGGLVGSNDNTNISDCGNYGDVWGTGDYVCGIVGSFSAYGIENCFNEGDIHSTGNYVAGIAGSTDIYGISNCINKGNISGNNYVAGICGSIENADVSNCHNLGNISGNKYVGGICGEGLPSRATDLWDSSISFSYNTGFVDGASYVGGIVGYARYTNVSNCINTANVLGTSSVGAGIGYSDSVWGRGTVENCYYLKNDYTNNMLNGMGNAPDVDGVITSKDEKFFCYNVDQTLNIYGHMYDNDCDTTCNNCYATRETTHDYLPATCQTSSVCLKCGKLIEQALGHKYEWKIDKEATCTEDGSKSRHCSRCESKVDSYIIKATGHNFVLDNTDSNHPHTITYGCSFCDEVKTETPVVVDCVECSFTITKITTNSYKLVSYVGTQTTVNIPAIHEGIAVTAIGNSCFKGNTGIKSVRIEDGITSIGSLAFMSCTSLEKVTIPASVTSIGTRAFYGFTGTIYCTRDSAAHQYAVANNIDFVLEDDLPITETEFTTIDYDDLVIRTSVQSVDDIANILGVSKTAEVIATASHVCGDVEFFGTGTIITVFDGDNYIGDFTLVVEGDTNGDSVCDALDAAQVALASNNLKPLDGAYAMAADSDLDDAIDISDYQVVLNKAVS